MVSGKWRVLKNDFSVDTEKGHAGVGGEPRYFIKFDNEPYKATFENEEGCTIIYLSVISNPDLIKPPGIFNIEYWEPKDRYSLHSFYNPENVEEWFDKTGIKDMPEVQTIYENMISFTNEIIETTQRCGFGVSEWAKEWLEYKKEERPFPDSHQPSVIK